MNACRRAAYHELDRSPRALKTTGMTSTWKLTVAALAVALVLGVTDRAEAQGYYGPPPGAQPRGVVRSGLIFGGALGLGAIAPSGCDNCDGLGSFALQGHIGGMIGPQLALMFDASALYHVFEDDSVLTSGTFLGVIRGWLGDMVWLQAGLGFGVLQATDQTGYYLEESRGGVAAGIGAGLEVLRSPNFTLDLQLRITGARYRYDADNRDDTFGITNAAFFVGFNWY